MAFAGTAEQFLADSEPGIEHKLIFINQELIGVFKIDTQYMNKYKFCESDCLGLRAFFIDHKYQGKGYGVKSMSQMVHYLPAEYPQYKGVYLTINCKNPTALSCYLKAGFIDSGDLFHGGLAGPQHIMKLLY